jgi:hypothetical protein
MVAMMPASSTPVGPATDDHDGLPRLTLRRARSDLGTLERNEKSVAESPGVGETLEARGLAFPFIVAEVRMTCAAGDNEKVERLMRRASVYLDALRRDNRSR